MIFSFLFVLPFIGSAEESRNLPRTLPPECYYADCVVGQLCDSEKAEEKESLTKERYEELFSGAPIRKVDSKEEGALARIQEWDDEDFSLLPADPGGCYEWKNQTLCCDQDPQRGKG